MVTSRFVPCLPLVLTLLSAALSAAPAATPEEQFDEMFAERIESAIGPMELAKFARNELLPAAEKVTEDAPFQAVVYFKAYEFAMGHPDGYRTAVEAMELLAAQQPALREAADAKMLSALEQGYDRSHPADARRAYGVDYLAKVLEVAEEKAEAGGFDDALALYGRAAPIAKFLGRDRVREVEASIKGVRERQDVAEKVAALKARLVKPGADGPAAAELVTLLVIEQDRPAETHEFLTAAAAADGTLAKMAGAAAKGVRTLTGDEALELGEWYRAQAGKATKVGKANALRRAEGCYERFLAEHPKEDARRLQADRRLSDVRTALAALPPHRQKEIDLLRLINLKEDLLRGEWTRAKRGGLLAVGSSVGRVRIPYQPPAEYDLLVEFTKEVATGNVVLLLSREGHSFMFLISLGDNGVCSFGKSGDAQADEKETTQNTPPSAQAGQRCGVRIEVRQDSVSAVVNGQQLITEMDPGKLYLDSLWNVGDSMLGLAVGSDTFSTDRAATAFHSIKLIEVSGAGKMVTSRTPRDQLKPDRYSKLPPDVARRGLPNSKYLRTVNLLPLIDPEKDARPGEWKKEAAGLATFVPNEWHYRSIPYQPPDEYDYRDL